MATRHLLAILQSHFRGDDSKLRSVALEIAADEARLGHGRVAEEIRDILSREHPRTLQPTVLAQPRDGELARTLDASYPAIRMSSMVLDESVRERLKRVIREQIQAPRLRANGFRARSRLLLSGMPGSGKTMTAAMLASELKWPLFTVRLESVMSRFLGETASRLEEVFDSMTRTAGVYFFDEFDGVGTRRDAPNDVGEMRRVVAYLLRAIERTDLLGIIVAATNDASALDPAFYRRFDDVLSYGPPNETQRLDLIRQTLSVFDAADFDLSALSKASNGLSQAEIVGAATDAAKLAILDERATLSTTDVIQSLEERQAARS